ncbi:MAG TPA: MauE/DoxX family redox-associated membrane protein [Spirillospora sp.]
MVTAVLDAQVLLLAGVLLAACLAKLTIREEPVGAPDRVHGVPVPAAFARLTSLRTSRRMTVGLGAGEGLLGLGLLVTPHASVRLTTAMAFVAATWVVSELRAVRPDAGCGCFGGLSSRRVGRRSVVRTMLFACAAVAALAAPHTGLDVLRDAEAPVGLVLAAELVVFALLSPELPLLFGRLPLGRLPFGGRCLPRGAGRSEMPCERRRSPIEETYATLHGSPVWARYEDVVTSAMPLDVWREGCWRFVVFPARMDDRDVEVVFAVSTAERGRTVLSSTVPREPVPQEKSGRRTPLPLSVSL